MLPKETLLKIAKAYGGMPIWGCLPGSPCYRAGVVYGDILLSVNGCETSSIDDYIEARKLDEVSFCARIWRNGTEFEVTVPLANPEASIRFVAEQGDNSMFLTNIRPPKGEGDVN